MRLRQVSPLLEWVIHYTNRETFSSAEGAPADALGWHVQAIAQQDATVGLLLHHGENFYCYDEALFGGWVGCDEYGLAQYLAEPGCKVIKLGHAMPTAAWRDLIAEIRADPRLPEKSARYEHERGDA